MMDTMPRETYQAQFDAIEREHGGQPEWLREMRNAAWARFHELGFPTTRQEEWKYTNVTSLARTPFQRPRSEADDPSVEKLVAGLYGDLDAVQAVFVDGRFSASLSGSLTAVDGLRVQSLADLVQTDPAAAQRVLGQSVSYEKNAFTALNTALVQDGVFLEVEEGSKIASPIHLVYVSTDAQPDGLSTVRNLIVAGARSQVTIIESYVSMGDESALTNAVTEITAGSGATVEHYKVQRENEQHYHVAATGVHQQADSSVSLTSVSLGGRLARNDIDVLLDGEHAECNLNGLYMGKGSQHMDFHTRIVHASPLTQSRELFKGVLTDHSHGVFNGAIIVHRDAQKIDSQMTNNNLLLSRDAEIDTKPELEIYADDVKCAHGATIGQLDETAIFYLQTRGIGRDAAKAMLTKAFARELLESIGVDAVRTALDEEVLAWLPEETQGATA